MKHPTPRLSAPQGRRRGRLQALLGAALVLTGCASRAPLAVVKDVDLDRFMGDWHVIACIPTFIERKAYGAIESYRRAPDGRILTTFTYHEGSLQGPLKTYHPVGFVVPGSGGAVWGMRFVWPIKADYRIMYLDPDYALTVVGREKRDYAWIMARTATISAADLQRMTTLLGESGYDTSALRQIPQQP